jgi:hypothetical protein
MVWSSHRQLDGVDAFFGRQLVDAGLGRQLDVDAEAVGVPAGGGDQRGIGVGNGLEVDVAAEVVHFAQQAGDMHQLLHRVVGRTDDAGTEEQAVDVVAQVKIDRQLDHFIDRKTRARHVGTAPVDAVLAVVDAEIGQQDLEQRDAAPVRRVAVADAHAAGGADAVLAVRRALGRTAAGAGGVVFRCVSEDFELVVQFHRRRHSLYIYTAYYTNGEGAAPDWAPVWHINNKSARQRISFRVQDNHVAPSQRAHAILDLAQVAHHQPGDLVRADKLARGIG